MTGRRSLAYKDRWLDYEISEITEDTTGDTVDNEIYIEPDTKTNLILEVTGEEYGKLFAALSIGVDLIYSDEADQLKWLLWKAAKGMSFCENVANCIDNSALVNQALLDWYIRNGLGTGGGTPETPLSEEILSTGMLPAGYVCDNDHLFGMANAIVLAIHDAVIETFQAIEVLTNPIELTAEITDNVPMAALASTALDLVTWIQDTAYENYNLAWSQVVQDELACMLLCRIDTCDMSFDDIWAVYLDIPDTSPPSLDAPWIDWFTWITELPFTVSLTTVQQCGLFGLAVMRWGGTFGTLSLGIRSLETVVQLSVDETNADWGTLCDPCSEWVHTFDFTVDDGGWELEPGFGDNGVYSPGVGWIGELGFQSTDIVTGISYMTQKTYVGQMLRFEVTVDYVKGTFDQQTLNALLCFDDDGGSEALLVSEVATGEIVLMLDYGSPVALDAINFFGISSRYPVAGVAGSITVTQIKVWGKGTDPYI